MNDSSSRITEPTVAERAAFTAPLRPDAVRTALESAGLSAGLSAGSLPATDAGAGPSPGVTIELVQQTGSTNADLLARARSEAPRAPLLRAAVVQTAGRGRLGRRWVSAPGSALLFSLALPQRSAAGVPSAATLVCGVALCEALHRAGVAARLKWPNDVLLDGRKLAGVLAELAVDSHGKRSLIVGIGVNLWTDETLIAQMGRSPATLAESLGIKALVGEREAWIGRFAAACIGALDEFEHRGFVPFQPRFMQRFEWVGRTVDVLEQGTRIATGQALGVDGSGRLLLEVEGRVRVFSSGEVSLRALEAA